MSQQIIKLHNSECWTGPEKYEKMLTAKCFIIVLSVAISIIATNAANESEYKKPFKLSCVSGANQRDFKFFWLQEGFEKTIRRRDLEIEFGKKKNFLFQFTGYGDSLSMDKPRSNFYLGRGIVQENPGQVVCYIDYAYGNDRTIARLMEYNNAIRQRIPYVINVMTNFVLKLKEFNLIKSMDSITTAGFCLGGHMAGILGRWLGSHFKEPIRMVLAFDPPKYGFEKGNHMFNERVQKGDAKYVEVTHTSGMGITTYDADTNVIVNDLNQPACKKGKIDFLNTCNHVAALYFHEHIFNITEPSPFYASTDKNQADNGDILLGFYNTDYTPKGVVYIKTKEDFQN